MREPVPHPMKFGKIVQARDAVRIGVLDLMAWLMPGKAVKAGPVDEKQTRSARSFRSLLSGQAHPSRPHGPTERDWEASWWRANSRGVASRSLGSSSRWTAENRRDQRLGCSRTSPRRRAQGKETGDATSTWTIDSSYGRRRGLSSRKHHSPRRAVPLSLSELLYSARRTDKERLRWLRRPIELARAQNSCSHLKPMSASLRAAQHSKARRP